MNLKTDRAFNLIKIQKSALIIAAFFLISGLCLIAFYDKHELHLIINSFNNDFFDSFFSIITFFGDGLIAILIVLLISIWSFRNSIITLTSFLLSGMIVQIFKHLIYPQAMRPAKLFQEKGIDIHLIEGVNQHSYHSFPSGHTAAVFAVFLSLAFIVKNKILKIFLSFFAVIVAFSRVYLSQHFVVDIVTGAFIAIISVIFAFLWLKDKKQNFMSLSFLKLLRK